MLSSDKWISGACSEFPGEWGRALQPRRKEGQLGGSRPTARVARPSQPSGLTTKGGPSCSSPGTCPPEVKNPEGEGTPQPKRRNPERKGTPWPKRRKTSGAPLRLSDARGEKMQSKPFGKHLRAQQ